MVNPSGRLPITLERALPDAASYGNYMPANAAFYDDQDWCSQCRAQFDVNYIEGIFFGYRHFDRTGVEPLFPFGFGLSYTTFAYSALSIQQTAEEDVQVSFYVRNTGERAGAEVAQLYIQDVESSVPRPLKELKGFTKLFLQAGEEQQATIVLPRRAFAFYDVTTHNWLVEPGLFRILIGANALDIRLNGDLNL
jgi:beta-glucosidase